MDIHCRMAKCILEITFHLLRHCHLDTFRFLMDVSFAELVTKFHHRRNSMHLQVFYGLCNGQSVFIICAAYNGHRIAFLDRLISNFDIGCKADAERLLNERNSGEQRLTKHSNGEYSTFVITWVTTRSGLILQWLLMTILDSDHHEDAVWCTLHAQTLTDVLFDGKL